MTACSALKIATVQAQRECDLPDYLAERLFQLSSDLQGTRVFDDELIALAEQVSLYDTYAQTGYIGMGVDNNILEGSICRLEERVKCGVKLDEKDE